MRKLGLGGLFQLVFMATLFVVVFRGHPPAPAQEPIAATIKDAVQDRDIHRLDQEMDSKDLQIAKITDAINANTNAVAGIQGEERGLAAFLILLQIGSFVFQVKRNGRTA